jgi:hypothetical protein
MVHNPVAGGQNAPAAIPVRSWCLMNISHILKKTRTTRLGFFNNFTMMFLASGFVQTRKACELYVQDGGRGNEKASALPAACRHILKFHKSPVMEVCHATPNPIQSVSEPSRPDLIFLNPFTSANAGIAHSTLVATLTLKTKTTKP